MASEEVKRKLTTILVTDVVGYSRLMAEDEESTIKTLRTYRKLIEDLVSKHYGRVFNTAGDAILVEFESAVEAVRCAITIQEDISVRNAQLPENRQIWFRVGINVGDVIVEGSDFFGDGVNVAARLEGVAEQGGICISGSAFEQVKNKLSIGFEDIGPQEVKNIPHAVAAYQIVPGKVNVEKNLAASGPDAEARKKWLPLPKQAKTRVAISIAAVAALASGIYWLAHLSQQEKPTRLLTNFDTNDMSEADIASLMLGMTIKFVGKKGGRRGSIRLKADGVAEAELTKKNSFEFDRTEIGSWWTKKNSFCMKFPRWSDGRTRCPHFKTQGGKIISYRGDGSIRDWDIYK